MVPNCLVVYNYMLYKKYYYNDFNFTLIILFLYFNIQMINMKKKNRKIMQQIILKK